MPGNTMSAPEATTIGVMEDRCDEAAAVILKRCRAARVWIAAAESLTGGLLADAFVRIPGASTVFLGSAVTYDIAAKASILRVNEALLRREGAVHPMVAAQMASSTARLYDQAAYRHRVIGLSTTGVAGPGPDGDKPAGLVYVGISVPVTLMPEPGQRADAELDSRGRSMVGSSACDTQWSWTRSGAADGRDAQPRDSFADRVIWVGQLHGAGSREGIRRFTVLRTLQKLSLLTANLQE